MGDKTGASYENLTQVIFQLIHGQNELLNISIQRNVILQGKTTSHQIDIYWKFENGGVRYETVVQAKDWNKPVDKGQLLEFKGVLDDLPGQPKGIFVTRSGYQSGAKEVALAHGILLYELGEADYPAPVAITVGGWAKYALLRMPLRGLVKNGESDIDTNNAIALGLAYDVCTPHYSEIKLDVSSNWLKQEYPAKDLSGVRQFPPEPLTDIALCNQEGTAIDNLYGLFSQLIAGMREEGVDQKRILHTFAQPTFIRMASWAIPYFKVDGLSVNVEIRHRHELHRLKMSNFPQLVLHELNSDRKLWFAATPSVISLFS